MNYHNDNNDKSDDNDDGINRSLDGHAAAMPPTTRAAVTATVAPTVDQKRIVFPRMLHRLLDESEANGTADVVSWLPCGTAFRVRRRDEFTKDVLPKYFRQTRYKSFVRQLNLWGFHCISHGVNKGSYTHDSFIRGEPNLCDAMRRTKIKGHAVARAAATASTRSRTEDGHVAQPSSSVGDVAAHPSAEDVSSPSFIDDLAATNFLLAHLEPASNGYEQMKIHVLAKPSESLQLVSDLSTSRHLPDLPTIDTDWLYHSTTSRDAATSAHPQEEAAPVQHRDATSSTGGSFTTQVEKPRSIPMGDASHDDTFHSNVGDFHFSFDSFGDDIDFELFQF